MPCLMTPLRRRQSWIAVFLFACYLPACTSWHVGTPTPAQFIESERPASVRVTRTDGTILTVTSPDIQSDSLVGLVPAPRDSQQTPRSISIALSDVSNVAVKKTSTGKTILLVGGMLLVVGVGLWVASYVAWCDDMGGCD